MIICCQPQLLTTGSILPQRKSQCPGLPEWPAYDPANDAVQVLDAQVRNAIHPRSAHMDRIEAIATQ